ncbi:MAG: hypothetical protein ABJQ29_03940 [Luteolibacter sp.]
MTKKTATVAAGCILLTIAGGVALKPHTGSSTDTTSTSENTTQRGEKRAARDANSETQNAGPDKHYSPRSSDADARLVARYGESRVKFSRHIAERTIYLNDLLEALKSRGATGKQTITTNGNVKIVSSGNVKVGSISIKDVSDPDNPRDLTEGTQELSEEDKARREILKEKMKEQMEAMREAQERLKEDSTPLQETLLAADAVSRGEMSQEEYDTIAAGSPKQNVFIGGFNGGSKKAVISNKPLSLTDAEKQVEKQIKTLESVNSLVISLEQD